jgi:uncharacterized phage infection (PIP) family protein YhgE
MRMKDKNIEVAERKAMAAANAHHETAERAKAAEDAARQAKSALKQAKKTYKAADDSARAARSDAKAAAKAFEKTAAKLAKVKSRLAKVEKAAKKATTKRRATQTASPPEPRARAGRSATGKKSSRRPVPSTASATGASRADRQGGRTDTFVTSGPDAG